MNNRDPFSLRSSQAGSAFASVHSTLSRSANTAAQRHSDEPDGNSVESQQNPSAAATTSMSYPVSRHAHTSSNDQPVPNDAWQPRRIQNDRRTSAFEEKFNELFQGKEGLPMYKDKPYNYSSSTRRLPIWRRKRLILALVAICGLLLYWTGAFSQKSTTSTTSHSSSSSFSSSSPTWDKRREKVKEAFQVSWKAYEKYAWGFDKYHPISQNGEQMIPTGMGWIIIDSLDTMMLMNLSTELVHAREWIATKLTWDQDHDVNTFETTIRMLGGLLSAHYLSEEYPDLASHHPDIEAHEGQDLYLETATVLAERLLGAFDSPSGIPYASINLKTRQGIKSHDDMGASSTAEAGSIQLEFKYLAHENGEYHFWNVSQRVNKAIDDNGVRDGLVPIYIFPDDGTFSGDNIRLGSRGDSYYEYLIKQYFQTQREEPIYREMWDQAFAGMKKHLITYTENSNLTILAERPSGLDHPLSPKMDHLVCFLPGTIAFSLTGGVTIAEAKKAKAWGPKQEQDMELAKELMKTCWGMYAVTPTGLAPEISYFHVAKPPPMMSDGVRKGPEITNDPNADWRKDYDIHANDVHNLQRPETVESLFYMWRITEDPMYREWGWQMFEAFAKHTFINDDSGYTSLSSVVKTPAPFKDDMESFWLAETLKYFYLLFGPNNLLPLDKVVFNTEAHPFPRFMPGPMFPTGWSRKPRDKDGNLIQPADSQAGTGTGTSAGNKDHVEAQDQNKQVNLGNEGGAHGAMTEHTDPAATTTTNKDTT